MDPHPSYAEMNRLWLAAWKTEVPAEIKRILLRSLTHVGAYREGVLVGFVNVAWDGGIHAFILDTCVHPDCRRQGVATGLVRMATAVAKQRGAHWLHVDYEPHLQGFYQVCGFRSSAAGVMDLTCFEP